jgi:uncharacterized protein YjbJ (UPF0337 family)
MIVITRDVFEGNWKQIRVSAKGWWGKLSNEELDQTNGKYDLFAGLLSERYGYTPPRAIEELDIRMKEYAGNLKRLTVPGHPR